MRTLALELSSARGSIASRAGDAIEFQREFPADRKHSGAFFENLQLCIEQFAPPDEIVVGLGPGSYAGTRIAIAAAIGLAAAAGAQLAGVPSLCAIPTDADEYIVIGDARRQTFFFAKVTARQLAHQPLLCTETELRERLQNVQVAVFATEAIEVFPQAVVSFPSASLLFAVVPRARAAEGPLEPMYLRAPHITHPRTAAGIAPQAR